MTKQRKLTPTNDLLFKKLFASRGNEEILKGILYDLTGRWFKSIQILLPYSLNTYKKSFDKVVNKADFYEKDVVLLKTEVDLLVKTEDGIVLTIEMQVNPRSNFFKRILLYACNKYGENYAVDPDLKDKYETLRPVWGINFLGYNAFEYDDVIVDYLLYNKKRKKIYTLTEDSLDPAFRILLVQLKAHDLDGNKNLKYLKQLFEGDEIDEDAPWYYKEASKIVSWHNLSEGERLQVEAVRKFEDNLQAEIAYGAEQGFEIGRKEGIAIGEARGEARGIAIGEERGIAIGEARGIELGEERGRALERRNIVISMYERGTDIRFIAGVVEMTEDEVMQIIDNHKN